MFVVYKAAFEGPFHDPNSDKPFFRVHMKPAIAGHGGVRYPTKPLVSTNAIDALKEAKVVYGVRHPIIGEI